MNHKVYECSKLVRFLAQNQETNRKLFDSVTRYIMIKSKQYQNLTFIVILNPPLKKVHNRIDATKDPKGEMNREHSLTL